MILDEIAARTRLRVAEAKKRIPLAAVRERAEAMPGRGGFAEALAAPGLSFICEIKKASPSTGVIAPDFPYLDIAAAYEAAGAAAISVLTEPEYFQGADRYLMEIAAQTALPLLRKDFTIDPYQIYEAKVMGASAVLLICALLEREALREYREIAASLGLAALVETHDEREVEAALDAGASIIGVNNRDLATFEVDITLSRRLRRLVPPERVFVAESGIVMPEDVAQLREAGVDAVLVGETLMRSGDVGMELRRLRGA
ncbi:MAG: indole-3-glycerol phosphate synthase TrpC [Lachnospiraceae bacterium]|jgi:indole-3-glycerol phosphate synthase|nr:indole-3-glycerol phosphate synthase TrpC [Lachnospiraceae bacterium]